MQKTMKLLTLGFIILLSKSEQAFLAVARYMSTKSVSRQRHGAVVVKSGRVLGVGFNKDKNNPFIVSPEHIKTHCSRHAEIEAIKDANWNVKGAILYVARLNRQGKDRNSKPCKYCEAVIKSAQIKKVIHTEG